MGIRNGDGVGLGLSPGGLITPHGDSEPVPVRGHQLQDCAHNPSWGFGTRRDPNANNRSTELITPHGDSELQRLNAASVACPFS